MQKKLDSKTISCYFVGYPDRTKGYRFYCPNHTTRFVETQRVVFIEEEKEETDTADFEFEEIIESKVNAEAGNKEKGVTILSFDNLNKEILPAHEDLSNHQNAEVEIHQNAEVEMQLNLLEQPQTIELRRSQRTRRPALPNDYFCLFARI
ncbi:hypothetical protein L3X38_003045 [Prunus dulcis]|uniref:Retroviral polymerase SH3-like domain-containing protein n=1 Tax=Prunus dulcis TaxID=3755 RepID=A0AAD4ZLA1_PRUDU|nr:hypothetical protein L3X38_003045 [Prunus dulcis]